MRAIHWFRNDLRLADNPAFSEACAADVLAPIFVFDDRLLAAKSQGAPRLRFLRDSVAALARRVEARGSRLFVRRGDPCLLIPALARELRADLVAWNADTTPYARRRDAAVRASLESAGIRVLARQDRVVFAADAVRTREGRPYTVYTPYRRAWWRHFEEDPPRPAPSRRMPGPPPRLAAGSIPSLFALGVRDEDCALPSAGEEVARRRLRRFLARDAAHYAERRDFPAADATSRLSPYLRFGAISIRACFLEAREAAAADARAARGIAKWLDELVWREFYAAILESFPRVLRGAFRREYDGLRWEQDERGFRAWCDGRTGYPFIDAAMRQLRTTGWMHNRARMVVASFLAKDLGIDWRRGERFFMQHLVDGDPASNDGGWQWAAGTGTDAQPFFRIFDPVAQGARFDPQGTYVRRFVPELSRLEGAAAHEPWLSPERAPAYPPRIVDHAARREQALARYRAARSGTRSPR
ncbi:MAG TPA: deoxyribodipyrimidine photo-lyase [Myxococcota bacterium]|nr:deoxyribodipyrimidine photo-lyase [Myxococcota bacterium]